MELGIFVSIIILLACAVVIATVFRRLNLPPILGYLVVGFIVGPYGLSWINDSDAAHHLAEFGVVFLMFTIGLEFSLGKMIAMKRTVLGLGGAQVAITTIIPMGIVLWLGYSLEDAIVAGGVMTLSSTAIVSKQLKDQLELSTPHGNNAISILLFQDLAVVPFLILIPSLAKGGDAVAMPLVFALIKGIMALFVMLFIGRWVLRPLFKEIASTRSLEIFTLTVLLVTLSSAWLTESLGLSLALGSFLAGMMLGETQFRHQIEVEIRPFRDVLLGLFFITIGMLLNFTMLPKIWPQLCILLLIIMPLKTLIIFILSRCFGHNTGTSLRTGLILAHGGEFGFALLALAINNNILMGPINQTLLAAVVISMALTPLIVRYSDKISVWLTPKSVDISVDDSHTNVEHSAEGLIDHIIICGFGRVGQNIARFLESENFDYIALDMNATTVHNAIMAGDRVVFGDSGNLHILQAAGLEKAKAVIISFNEFAITMQILHQIRNISPKIPILVRTRDDHNLTVLQKAGATEIVPETLEASLMLAFQTLMIMGIHPDKALQNMLDARKNHYQLLHQFFPDIEDRIFTNSESVQQQLSVVVLTENAYAVDKKIRELSLGDVKIYAVKRAGIKGSAPEPDTVLKIDDVLVIYGTPEQLEEATTIILEG